jgi:hypothetical protein
MATDDMSVSSHGDDLDPLADVGELEEAEVLDALPATVDDLSPTKDGSLEDDEEFADDEYDSRGGGFRIGGFLTNMGAFSVSVIFHIVLLVVLGLLIFEDTTKAAINTIVATVMEERPEDAPIEIELNEKIEQVDEQTIAVFTPSSMGAAGPATAAAGEVKFDQTLVETAEKVAINVSPPTVGIPDSIGLIEAVPDGDVKGDPRAIVENYEQAFDHITQEIMWMLDKGPVLVMWCFDQSESMKDDQREIRERVANVYNQLGIVGTNNSTALLTSITSYGKAFAVHTQKPTSNREEIVNAIDAVPIDPSGEEMMCQAVGATISGNRKFASRGRQMALILVTDESGNRNNNDRYLEAAIAQAKSSNCKIFVLGRESVFGYPYAHIRWIHPQTGGHHWLRIDRGPETGFPEQLQTNGFRRRHDAASSGFGPYEQTRMARETNGVFFMLPSVETNLVGANKQRFELEAMRPFRPDLSARIEVLKARDDHPLRALIWKVIWDLNPYNPAVQKQVELQIAYPLNAPGFLKAARANQAKAMMLIKYMGEAQKALEDGKHLRDQEPDPRWQANYDLIYAQLIAYQARIYEYGAALEDFIQNPKTVPAMKGTARLVHWDIHVTKSIRSEESAAYIKKAAELLEATSKEFAGTPWAIRADYERNRGYGVDLHPDYHQPLRRVPTGTPVDPIPKL